MKKEKWKRVLNAVFVVCIFAATTYTVFRGEDFWEVLHFLTVADAEYVLPSLAFVVLFISGEAVVICYLFRTLGIKVGLLKCGLYSFIGFFYCCVTPSASGGQPMQVLYMRKGGIPVAISTVALAIITIVYKLVLVLTTGLILLFRPPVLMLHLEPVKTLVYLGLLLNLVCIAALLLLVFYPAIVRTLAEKTFRLIHRIRPMKHLQRRQTQLELILHQYQGTAAYYRNHKRDIFYVFIIKIVCDII